MMLLDTSGLLSAIDASERHHRACAQVVAGAIGPLLLSPFVLAELDYLLATQVGQPPQLDLLDEVARTAYRLERFETADIVVAAEVMRRYADLHIGLADASVVVLSGRYGVRDVLTLDERHFRALRTPDRRRFRILPADA